ncbi:5-bromo-4-chloroindolyl phosphate hydrolysis family protein [Vagococcus xieshaowenii]|uniref:5-bromo-4-chloroindolyl phosphate hydrolysis protein n=2 Tax=Vagococcus xieshaowenii TaxID=2562451 RepID=A0AAJ5EGX2_9ENTE|nr:5-bromo-4-chloroindolyl phosphate hydrolysis family protein [Vagococcus xieshaowenii]QCA28914.1 5-bromo-4-chloroindolyl phosphate hydrolysis protein [Vagococcus xieshaowenii]TFZ43332.1 5-bromo-4-chloroindolyl phosphate hydrolysis protein [Vagococcus xieshaowenii]
MIPLAALFIDSLTNGSTIIAIIIGILMVRLIIKLLTTIKKGKEIKLPAMSKEKSEHYESLGMSDQQIEFFRETMQTAKEQIKALDTNMNSVTKLKAINLRTDAVKITKSLFKRLADEPNKLHLADGFLYHHLPNILELTDKYIEINNHEVKTKTSYEALEKSAAMIEKVAILLLEDYERFVKDDMDELDVELTLAEQNISRKEEKNLEDITKETTASTPDKED